MRAASFVFDRGAAALYFFTRAMCLVLKKVDTISTNIIK